jgi:membrane-associated phospholipid phosphatase
MLATLRRQPSLLVLTLVAVARSELVTDVLKLVIPRDRPYVPGLVALPGGHWFPSGDAATSFACAIVLAAFLPRLRVPLDVLAALVA